MSLIRALACFVLLSAVTLAQAPPQFDVASVKPSADGLAPSVGLRITGSQLRIASLSLRDYVGMAYRVRPPQVIAPEWMAQNRFDIAANVPDGATRDDVPGMLKALLADRFQLKAHLEMREFPVYALTVSTRGLKIRESAPDPDATASNVVVAGGGSRAGVILDLGGGASFSLADNRLEAKRITMTQLADLLTRFTDRTVVDASMLAGRYDLVIDLSPEDYQAILTRAGANAGLLPPQALRYLETAGNPLPVVIETTGLALEPRRAPLDVVVVDSALKAPTEN